MRLSEKDAETKWCPEARLAVQFGEAGAASYNRTQGRTNWTYCIGSQCMMWRWAKRSDDLSSRDRDGNPLGYCGLAGTPE